MAGINYRNKSFHGSIVFIIACLLFANYPVYSQNSSLIKSFANVSRPEKWWAVTHLFIAKKAFEAAQQSREISRRLVEESALDGDIHGGQVDAFKHSYWMAMLAQKIKPRKARSLGKAHEKGDYLSFKKSTKKGETSIHDLAASKMDLYNNNVGIEIGEKHQEADHIELKGIIIDAILKGEMLILKKDRQGNYLDENNHIIPKEKLKKSWESGRVTVPSDQLYFATQD